MTASHAHRAGRVRLSIAARRGGAARRPQPRDRAERQRQVQPVSGAAAARRRGAGPRDRVAGAGGRPGVGAVGGAGADRAIGQGGTTRSRARGARARSACGSGSRRTTSATPSISGCRYGRLRRPFAARSGDQARMHLERADAAAARRAGRSAGPLVRARPTATGPSVTQRLATFDSMMTHCADPRNTPEMLMLRERSAAGASTITSAPTRRRRRAAADRHAHAGARPRRPRPRGGAETIREIGDAEALARPIDDAFPGARVSVRVTATAGSRSRCSSTACCAAEGRRASDGTLRYLLWIAALLTPRPPALLVLNEPETSLHPDLLPALGA